MNLKKLTWSHWYSSNDDLVLQESNHKQAFEFQSTYKSEPFTTVAREKESVESFKNSSVKRPHPVLTRGWRVAGCVAAAMVCCTLSINIAIMAWLSKTTSFKNGLAQLFSGDCDKVQSINTWVHSAINLLSTFILAGSNFTMQVLVGPSRNEIDRAHCDGKWLDIGVPSIRNLTSISKIRALLWLILGLSSIPLHLLYVCSLALEPYPSESCLLSLYSQLQLSFLPDTCSK